MLLDLKVKLFFPLFSEKYLYVVISPSDGTYNHLTYFEKNRSMRGEPKNMVLAFDVLTPKVPSLSRFTNFKLERNNVERVN